ncbi:MAG: PspA-associated protein PspAB [Jiangellaceae bacterium]
MGLFDALLGRTKQAQPNLDALFSLPGAALTLEAAAEIRPTGVGAVCFREAEGGPFVRLKDEITALLGGSEPEEVRDGFGYTWLVVRRPAADVPALVTDLHAVNSTLEGEGFGPSLLCSTIGLRTDSGQSLVLVYLYKRGTFYPFAPVDEKQHRRDSVLELQVRALVSGDLPIEPEVSRWFAVWGAPGL